MALLCAVFAAPPAFADPDNFGNGNGHNGALTVTTANRVINTYTRLTANANAGATTVSVNSITGFAVGDLIMVFQSTGYTGTVVTGAQAPFDAAATPVGNWNFARVTARAGTTLTFAPALTSNFTGSPPDNDITLRSSAQVIRVPEYTDVTINAGASLSARAWSSDAEFRDTVGGLVVFFATGTVTNNGTISAAGAGFRGGEKFNGSGDSCTQLDEEWEGGAMKG
ncbi:adhesin, partial [Corallococcus sp. AB050B]